MKDITLYIDAHAVHNHAFREPYIRIQMVVSRMNEQYCTHAHDRSVGPMNVHPTGRDVLHLDRELKLTLQIDSCGRVEQ